MRKPVHPTLECFVTNDYSVLREGLQSAGGDIVGERVEAELPEKEPKPPSYHTTHLPVKYNAADAATSVAMLTSNNDQAKNFRVDEDAYRYYLYLNNENLNWQRTH